MKHYIKKIIVVAAIVIVSVWIVDKIPFNKNIDQQITANIYENGVIVGQTIVTMNGEKSRYLFRQDDGFIGEFNIPYVKKTDIEDLQTYIKWNDEDNTQFMRHFYKGDIKTADTRGIVPYLLINDSMTNFCIMLTDYTVIATSDEWFELYTKHISYHGDGRVSINDVNLIPKID